MIFKAYPHPEPEPEEAMSNEENEGEMAAFERMMVENIENLGWENAEALAAGSTKKGTRKPRKNKGRKSSTPASK